MREEKVEQEPEELTPVQNNETAETESPSEEIQVNMPVSPEIIQEETPVTEEPIQAEVVQAPIVPQVDPYQKTFDNLVKKIYDRNYELGACFERNIEFESFSDNKLTWGSSAEGEDKNQLRLQWGMINMFVKDLFGFETKIVNIAKKKINTTKTLEQTPRVDKCPTEMPLGATLQQNIPHVDADAGSMIEDIEMKSSCIAPEAGETEAAKEKDPSTLLEEPMIKEAIALFDPKKVRIKRNS